MTNCEQGVHSIGRFVDLIELGSSLEVFESEDEEEDVREGSDRVRVTSQHEVGESDVVVDGDVGRGDSGEERLLVQVDSVEHREGESVISEEDVNANETED